jgi:hypothetical protein
MVQVHPRYANIFFNGERILRYLNGVLDESYNVPQNDIYI